MTLSIGRAFSRGLRRPLNAPGAVLTVLTFTYVALFVGSLNTVMATLLPAEVRDQAGFGFTFPLPRSAAIVLGVVALLFGLVVFIATVRAFTRDEAEWGRLPTSLFTRRIGRAVAAAVTAQILVSVAVMIGFALLVLPGVFLTVSFVFVVYAIGVEDAGPIGAMRRSWDLARGDRWRLLALLIVVGVVTGLVSSLGSLYAVVNPTGGQLLSLVLTAPLSVLGYGVIADAYVQLSAGEASPSDDGDAGVDGSASAP